MTLFVILEPRPDPVTGLTATLNNMITNLSWNAVSGVLHYRVHRRFGTTGAINFLATQFSNSFADNTLTLDDSGQTVQYFVTVVTSGGESGFGTPAEITLPALASRPRIRNLRGVDTAIVLSIERNSDNDPIDLTFSETSTTSGFQTLRNNVNTNNDDRAQYLSLVGGTVSDDRVYFVHDGLSSGDSIHYRAYSRNDLGRGTSFDAESETA